MTRDVNNNNHNNNEAENILKYKDLTIGIKRMWNVKTKVIPVIIGATGIISKSFRKYVSNIPGKHEVKELQKTITLLCRWPSGAQIERGLSQPVHRMATYKCDDTR